MTPLEMACLIYPILFIGLGVPLLLLVGPQRRNGR
jgi:uncharacterized membrane protein YhdT